MNKAVVPLVIFMSMIGAVGAVAQNEKANEITNSRSDMSEKTYQDEIISNPQTSGAARAETAYSGGNTAIINQSGYSNASSVVQSGDDNVAEQIQRGEYNDLRVEQIGKHNRSHESQTGKHNRKVKIQHDTETIIEQVTP